MSGHKLSDATKAKLSAANLARWRLRNEKSALEAAVVEAAMAWVKHGEIWGSAIANLFDACAALRKFRERDGGR